MSGRIGVRGGMVLGFVLLACDQVGPPRGDPRAPQGQDESPPRTQVVAPELSHVVTVAHHEAMNPAMALDESGRLFVAHRPAPGDRLLVSRLDQASGSWLAIAGALNERAVAHLVTIAFDRQGVLHAAFLQEQPSGEAYDLVVRRVKDGAWQDCAQRLDVGVAHFYFKADLGFDDRNRLLLAYSDAGGRLRVQRRDPGGWTELAALGTLRYGLRMVIKPDGQPAIAYLQSKAGSDETTLEVIAREGERWVPVGGTVDRAEGLGELLSPPRLVWEAGGAWLAWTRGSQVQVARHTGQSWDQVAPALQARGGRIAFALVERDPLIVAATDAGFATRVLRFHGGAWSAAFDATPAEASGLGTGPILAARGATLYLAFPGLGNRCPLEQVRFASEIP